jgi:hypothetical protein
MVNPVDHRFTPPAYWCFTEASMTRFSPEREMDGTPIEIDHRFRGPPHSGNGGYVSGLLARHAGMANAAEVTLRAPTPLGRPLSLFQTDNGEVSMMDGMTHIAAIRPFDVCVDPLPQASLEQARAATDRSIGPDRHVLPECFVCGPGRAHGDGLRVFAGPLDPNDTGWTGPLAAAWTPDESVAGDDGRVATEFLWSALDCPTGYTALRPDGHGKGKNQSMLLGRIQVRIERRPPVGAPCLLVTRMIGREGRKITADGILRDTSGETLAIARALWITVDKELLLANRTG